MRQIAIADIIEQRRDAVITVWELCRDACLSDAQRMIVDDLFMQQIEYIDNDFALWCGKIDK